MGNKFTRILWLCFALLMVWLLAPNRTLAQGGGPNALLHQCANDSDGSNATCANGPSIGWINNIINAGNGSYLLGDFYPNRQVFSNLTVGNDYCFAVGYDYSKGALPAVDYLGTYNYSWPADPTLGTGFTLGVDAPNTIAIPQDPAILGGGTIGGNSYVNPLTHIPGDLTLWGGTFIPGSLIYSNPGMGDLDTEFAQSLDYCFTATNTEAVMAFGAHIAIPQEWGLQQRPTGAAYHISSGSRNDFYAAPRSSETDLVEIAPGGAVISHNNIGRRDQQIQDSAIIEPSPTAITLLGMGEPAGQRTIAYLLGTVMLGLSVVSVVVTRHEKVWRRR